jgi:hypothetical protein
MKVKFFFIVFTLLCLLHSCSRSDDRSSDGDNPNGGDFTTITFENSTFTGSVLVTYTDGSSENATFEDGVCEIPLSGEDKTIAKIQPQDQNNILIGRKEGTPIILNYNNGVLQHRVQMNGFIPIGTYAEFQLINNALANNYKLEYDLDFMNLQWMPLGGAYGNGFSGEFDGNNQEISNMKIQSNSNEGSSGLFRKVSSGGKISNLTIRSGSIQTPDTYLGSIAGSIDNNTIISNCTNYADILITVNDSYERYAGGITGGGDGIVSNCKNYGNVQGTYASGIAFLSATAANCHNYGDITGKNETYGITRGSASDCSNEGVITLNGTNENLRYIAGICRSNTTNCTNSGEINVSITNASSYNGWVYVGGIAYNGQAQNSHNSGNINITTPNNGSTVVNVTTGGIVAISDAVINCSNIGNITINSVSHSSSVGGIVGDGRGFVNSCFNTGNINRNGPNSSYSIGGIVGFWYGNDSNMELHSCYNKGNIEAYSSSTQPSYNRFVGGILGQISYVNGTLHNSYNIGSIKGGNFNGGLIGLLTFDSFITISNNYWEDLATDNAQYATGGISYYINGYYGINPGNNSGASFFSATTWPSVSQGWNVGNGTGNAYWKLLGSWNNGNPIYPKLWFEE